jgi:hypothetical protein
MTTLALLHTSPVHTATFDALRDELAPEVELVHVVREDLLAAARDGADVSAEVAAAVTDALAGTDAVLCTCSTIGALAEDAGALRVDRPMAAAAAAHDRPVVVLAALEPTIAPTLALLASEGARDVSAQVVAGAWDRFESGDLDGYLDLVAAAADAVDPGAVVVLAQASMAAAAARTAVPLLSSPRLGFEAAVRSAQASA